MSWDFDISVLLPTRGRPRQAEGMLRSLVESAACREKIELVLYVDLDDVASHKLNTQGLQTTQLIRPRALMGVMTNACYRASTGRNILLANDDVVFRTKGWDLGFLESLSHFADGIGFVWGNDGFTGGPTHPMFPRTLCELMGGVCPDAYDRVFIDVHLHDLFQKLKALGHDRLRYLADVSIEHIHVDAGKSQADPTSLKSHLHDDEMTYIHFEDERAALAGDLADYIVQSREAAKTQDISSGPEYLARAA